MLYEFHVKLNVVDVLAKDGFSAANPLHPEHALNVTVPGAAAGWVDTVERFGSGKVLQLCYSFSLLNLNGALVFSSSLC